jgi:hypothetical protein
MKNESLGNPSKRIACIKSVQIRTAEIEIQMVATSGINTRIVTTIS